MSTLAAARADNMYYPPEWRPEMGGISKFQGSKGANQYEQYGKIRFELPVHGWCLGCGRHIGRGTRFNATKDQMGTYYTTKIWQFTMKCPSCSTVLVIKTDPKNTDYEYVEGIRKKDMAFDPEEAQTQRVQDSEVSNKLAVDPLYRLEHEQADRRRAASRKTVLTQLTELSGAHGRDDYSANARLRQGMRSRKKKDKERDDEAKARGLGIRLATPSPADAVAAGKIKYRSRHKSFKTGEKAKMATISGESIFGSGSESASQARRKAVLTKAARLGIKTKGMKLLEPDRVLNGNSGSDNSSGKRLASDLAVSLSREEVHRNSTFKHSPRKHSRKRPRSDGTAGEPAMDIDNNGFREVDSLEFRFGRTQRHFTDGTPSDGKKRHNPHHMGSRADDYFDHSPISASDVAETRQRDSAGSLSVGRDSGTQLLRRAHKLIKGVRVSSARHSKKSMSNRESLGVSSESSSPGGLAAIAGSY